MSIISHLFNATAEKITSSTNEYNDVSYSSTGSTVSCYFRESDRLDDTGQNTEIEVSQANPQLWFDPDVSTDKGDIWLVHGAESLYWRITSIIRARRGGESAVKFLKCEIERYWVVS